MTDGRLHFTVPGKPRGKGRPRFDTRTGRAFTPKETREYERAVMVSAERAREGYAALVGPWPMGKATRYRVDVVAYFANGVRCDGDNLLKAVCDALNGVLYEDDRQVDVQSVMRLTDTDNPRVEVTVQVMA